MAKDIYGDFYNPTKLISTGKPYLFSLGVRSSGKSTGWLIHLVKAFSAVASSSSLSRLRYMNCFPLCIYSFNK